ncbi:caspase family protein [Frigidibacter sp. ROC022]|uniref:caspase family protein n=1 Tax=Frigidibacter sp. ROC022 TaxID=2971796 RepID=UPI00215A362F|nr:caspase family protein [Frigidibacter sp. ROC022]MCR8723315.1 caspase family protein [Frigidibacter sp. ROC022]
MFHARRFSARVLAVALALAAPGLARAADRIALVIGMANYAHIEPLSNTLNDARGIAQTLKGIGFDVTLTLDTKGDDLRQIVDDFAFRSETADLALIYYAGHGVEVQGENFLIPVDAEIRSNVDVQRQSVSLKQLLVAVDHARKMRVIILDSCRNNPLGDALDLTQLQQPGQPAGDGTTRGAGGLAVPSPDRGTLVAFAARDGQVALDGLGANSPYATALMEKLPQPGLEISLMFRQVRDQVLKATGNLQEPHTYGSLSGEPFYVAGSGTGNVADVSVLDPTLAWAAIAPEQEPQFLALADAGDTRSMLGLAYMRLNPDSDRYDPVEAAGFLERAAEAGAPDAQWELARLYEKGIIGTAPDPVKALELFRKSADQEYAKALNDMGFFYYQGSLGLTQDKAKALDYFRRAADQRHPEAQFNYAALIDDGLVEGKGPEDAARYLYEALRSGNEDVLNLLSERPTMFSAETRRDLQAILKKFSFYKGPLDGDFGPGTQKSIREAFGIES